MQFEHGPPSKRSSPSKPRRYPAEVSVLLFFSFPHSRA
jgi:hypothetical protein